METTIYSDLFDFDDRMPFHFNLGGGSKRNENRNKEHWIEIEREKVKEEIKEDKLDRFCMGYMELYMW